MTRPAAFRVIAAAGCTLLAVAACGGSSGGTVVPSSPPHPAASPTRPVPSASPLPSGPSSSTPSARDATLLRLNRAFLTRSQTPRPTRVFCRDATTAEIANGPFGHSSSPQFSCRLTIAGSKARYDVQLLHNGCYVAERRQPGKAIYGCEARNSG